MQLSPATSYFISLRLWHVPHIHTWSKTVTNLSNVLRSFCINSSHFNVTLSRWYLEQNAAVAKNHLQHNIHTLQLIWFVGKYKNYTLIHKEIFLLGYNTVRSTENQIMFTGKILLPSPGSKNKPSKKPVWSRQQAEPDLTDYMAPYPRRYNSS